MSKLVVFSRYFALSGVLLASVCTLAAASEPAVRVVSNRIASTTANWGNDSTQATGPVILRVPGFGEVFVSVCFEGNQPLFGLRNTSNEAFDIVGVMFFLPSPSSPNFESPSPPRGKLLPGEVAALHTSYSAIDHVPANMLSIQLGAGSGRNARIATVLASAQRDDSQGECRFQAQTVVHTF